MANELSLFSLQGRAKRRNKRKASTVTHKLRIVFYHFFIFSPVSATNWTKQPIIVVCHFQMGSESGIVARVTKRVLLQNLSNENNFDLHENDPEHETHFYWFRMKTRFETEANDNSEMA